MTRNCSIEATFLTMEKWWFYGMKMKGKNVVKMGGSGG